MKIRTLLEGHIKVPQEAFKDVMTAVCADVFSRIVTYLNSPEADDYFDNLLKYKQLIKKYRSQYGNFDVFNDHDGSRVTQMKVYVRMNEVDPRYLKKNPSARNKTYAIIVTISPSGEHRTPSGEYYKKQSLTAAKLNIEIPTQATIEQVARSPELLETLMDRIEGMVEHELMHAIQDMALKQFPTEVSYYKDDGTVDREKYYTSEVEFSPQIISNAKEFIAFAKDVKAAGYTLDAEGTKTLLMNFVKPGAPQVRGVQDNHSPFFSMLYQKDKAKWKKAVKYFYGLVQGKF